MPDKPHVLLLIDDEHRPDVLGIEGNPHVRTPTLDRCMEQGTYFRSAYTPSPVCVPARQSFLTGLYPRHNGCTGFDTPLPSDVLTIPSHLMHYGYFPACAGKMHFIGTDQLHGWRERIGREMSYARDDSPLRHLAAAADPARRASRNPEPGTGKWSTAKEITNARVGTGLSLAQDLYTTDGALLFLDEIFVDSAYDRPRDQPLLMAVSLNSPHYPYQCSEDLFSYYLRRVEPFVEDLQDDFDCNDFFKIKIGQDVTLREAHRATAAYYGMVETVDQQYARVINRLEELGVLDDFIIVFLTDHGEMLGQKGLWEKQQFFEASARVPFSVSAPQVVPNAESIDRHNVSLVDLFPTLCDLVDVPIPEGLDGQSLVPLMQGQAAGWANTVYSELYHELNGPAEMVKIDDLKYFRFLGREWPEQLFDLAKDPEERHNLIADPAYAADLQRLRGRLDAFEHTREARAF
jgi:choline-sulfatase